MGTVAQIKGRTTNDSEESAVDEGTKRNSALRLEEETTKESETWKETRHSIASSSSPSSSSVSAVIDNSLDWFEAKRNLAYVLYGGIFVGLASHIEYNHLFPLIFGSEHNAKTIIEKVLF